MSLERDGMPDYSAPCENGYPCVSYSMDKRSGETWEHTCPELCSQVVDFGTAGKLPVYWCKRDYEAGELQLMTADEIRSPR